MLWHLRSSTAVSILAQELMATSPRSCAAWIATGNVFSLLEDHGSALKCFRRASQLDDRNIFAFTLSGHECVSMEEWDRALNFFREAIRLDPKSYSAWYGMGSTYYQSGQYRLAEYHFRKASDLNPTNAILLTLTANARAFSPVKTKTNPANCSLGARKAWSSARSARTARQGVPRCACKCRCAHEASQGPHGLQRICRSSLSVMQGAGAK